MKIRNDIKAYLISEKASILEAMKVIDKGEERTGFLVDSKRKLIKVITDGDIRRAILKGAEIHDAVRDIHDQGPHVFHERQSLDEARKYLSKKVTVVPVVDDRMIVKGLIRFHDVQPFINIRSREVLVLGLGYVGLTFALNLAENGFSVMGYDTDRSLIENLKNKIAPFHEQGLDTYMKKHIGAGLRLTFDIRNIKADIFVITVGTPIDKQTREPNLTYVGDAVRSVAKIIKGNDLVIMRSTLPLGATRQQVLPLLEKDSGLRTGADFYLAFCPERTAEGKALEELNKNPQIIGAYDPLSAELANRLFGENTHTVVNVGSLEAAEMCKLIDNTYRDALFGYSNQMALLCEKAGLNLSHLIDKVNLGYERNLIPKPSPGVGGACLSKDPYILMHNFSQFGLEASVSKAARQINEMAPKSIFERSRSMLLGVDKNLELAKVFIVGFSFKGEPETSDLRESTTLWFLEEMRRNNVRDIWGYDPVVGLDEIERLGVTPCSIEEGFKEVDAVFFMNNHRSYVNLKIFSLIETMNQPALFFDSWQVFQDAGICDLDGIIYTGVGVG